MIRIIRDQRGRKRHVQMTYRDYQGLIDRIADYRIASILLADELRREKKRVLPAKLRPVDAQRN